MSLKKSYLAFWMVFIAMTVVAQTNTFPVSGNVGIGTTNPQISLDVNGMVRMTGFGSPSSGVGLELGYVSAVGGILQGYNRSLSSYIPVAIAGSTVSLNIGATTFFQINPSGNVGIGTTLPGARLEVNGNIRLTSGSGASVTFADGTVQSTAWTGSLCGGDYAESVDVSGDRSRYEPGDVLVVDPNDSARFLKSSEPYSTLVAGIYSTKPGLLGRRQTTDPKTSTTEVPMAMVGIVPTKVSAENGPIKRGNLLVTSSTVGYAMKGTDRNLLTGAIVGKALAPLESGLGVIEVLVSLQ
jgi:hypothetical protein